MRRGWLCLCLLSLLLCGCSKAGESAVLVTPRPRTESAAPAPEEADRSGEALPAYTALLEETPRARGAAVRNFCGDGTAELIVLTEDALLLYGWDGESITVLDTLPLEEGAALWQNRPGGALLLLTGEERICLGGEGEYRSTVLTRRGEDCLLNGEKVEPDRYYQALAEFPAETGEELLSVLRREGIALPPPEG